jgi:uncharacterized Zn-binding protein involved in type VI secretion
MICDTDRAGPPPRKPGSNVAQVTSTRVAGCWACISAADQVSVSDVALTAFF